MARETAAQKKTRLAEEAAKTETKAQKFARLGSMRATKAINAMRGIQKLSNQANYEYTPEQVEKLLAALTAEVEAIHTAFTTVGAETKETFTL